VRLGCLGPEAFQLGCLDPEAFQLGSLIRRKRSVLASRLRLTASLRHAHLAVTSVRPQHSAVLMLR
jgi:hypothetical protein